MLRESLDVAEIFLARSLSLLLLFLRQVWLLHTTDKKCCACDTVQVAVLALFLMVYRGGRSGPPCKQVRHRASHANVLRNSKTNPQKIARDTKGSFVPATWRLNSLAQTSCSQRLTAQNKMRRKRKASFTHVRTIRWRL